MERLDRCGLNFGDATMGNFGTAWWWSRAGWGCRSAGIGGVDQGLTPQTPVGAGGISRGTGGPGKGKRDQGHEQNREFD